MMKTLLFDQDFDKHSVNVPYIRDIRDYEERYNPNGNIWHSNGLFNAIHRAYSKHFELTISPDDIYNNVCALWAKYITVNAEKFREQIVSHVGKKELLIDIFNEPWSKELVLKCIDLYIHMINMDNNKSIQWMQHSFSTTTESDSFVRKVSILSSQKQYYDYNFMPCCWLPKINLTGTELDWYDLKNIISNMPTFDDDMACWKDKLVIFIDQCIHCEDEDFWQTPLVESVKAGSGRMDYYTGWITLFNPFNEAGKWGESRDKWYKIKSSNILNLSVDFTINCLSNDGSRKKVGEIAIVAGPTSFTLSKNGIFVTNTGDYKHIEL